MEKYRVIVRSGLILGAFAAIGLGAISFFGETDRLSFDHKTKVFYASVAQDQISTHESSAQESQLRDTQERNRNEIVQGDSKSEYVHADEQVFLQDELTAATLLVSGQEYAAQMQEESTVYEFMEELRLNHGLDFQGREFPGVGFFVEEINGLSNNLREGKYWIYYINGKKAMVGISHYTLKTNDIIEWKYEDEE